MADITQLPQSEEQAIKQMLFQLLMDKYSWLLTFNSGIRPAINVGISVSRVGSGAQIKAVLSL